MAMAAQSCCACDYRMGGIIRVGSGRLGRCEDTTINSVGFQCVDGGEGYNAVGTLMSAHWKGTM